MLVTAPSSDHPFEGARSARDRLRTVITVVGEALIDLVVDQRGDVTAALGGAPFNTARACGRLGADVAFVGALSDDRFGSMLRAQLVEDGVDVSGAPVVTVPTTLAAAELDERGAATYRFYIEGTSAPSLTSVPQLGAGGALVTGGLALVLEPMAVTVERTLAEVDRSTLVMVDVNCRPLVVPDRSVYVERVARVVARSHLVKVSDEDLAYLVPGADPVDAAHGVLDRGPSAVLLTRGGSGVHVVTSDGDRFVAVEPVEVVDTIGAGDTFGGGLVTWLTSNEITTDRVGDPDLLARAVHAANVAAGVACTRRGADPPHRADLPGDWSS